MLGVIESLLAPALRQALGDGATLLLAPAGAPPGDGLPQVCLFCSALTRWPAADAAAGGVAGGAGAGADPSDHREPAHALWQRTLAPDAADPARVDLPADAPGTVVQVQSPPGRLQALGDDCRVEQGALRFLQPPSGQVRVTWRGDRLRGHVERFAVQVEVDLGVWAPDAAAADRWLGSALAALLAAFAELDLIDLAEPPAAADPDGAAPRLSMRLLRPVAGLAGIARGVRLVESQRWTRHDAVITLRGELELSLALGRPEPASTIRQIQVGIDTPKATTGVQHQDGTIGG